MSDKVVITDVGPRDGLQNQATILTPEQRLELITGLVLAGVEHIEAGAFVSPKAVPAMAGTDVIFHALANLDKGHFQALIPNLKGYELAKAAGAKSVLVVVCATETMNQKNVRMSIAQSVQNIQAIAAQAKQDDIQVIACIAVAWHCPFEGATPPLAVRSLATQLTSIGVSNLVIADTIGAANPRSVNALMSMLLTEHSVDHLGCHFHDTRAMGLANVYAAYEAGVRRFDASVGGLGGCPFAPGATGNVATEDVVMMFEQMGVSTGIELEKLMQVGQIAGTMTQQSTGGRAHTWRTLQTQR